MNSDLSERKKRILRIVVDEYIDSAAPVSSKTIVERHLTDISSATVRNELAALEDQGFLLQFHTSGGRVPSAKAYQFYIDELLDKSEFTPEQVGLVLQKVEERANASESIVKRVADVISELTDYTSVGISASGEEVISNVGLFPVGNRALLLLVTDLRIFKDNFIDLPEGLDGEALAEIERMLKRVFCGKKLGEVRFAEEEALKAFHAYRDFCRNVLDALIAYSESKSVVLSGGSKSLRRPEYDDVGKVQEFLSLVESKEKMEAVLSGDSDIRIRVKIGSEGVPENCSLVTASYSAGGKQLGTYGVVGPVRMDYAKVVSVLECVGEILETMLK